jgi:hypothetical protein
MPFAKKKSQLLLQENKEIFRVMMMMMTKKSHRLESQDWNYRKRHPTKKEPEKDIYLHRRRTTWTLLPTRTLRS